MAGAAVKDRQLLANMARVVPHDCDVRWPAILSFAEIPLVCQKRILLAVALRAPFEVEGPNQCPEFIYTSGHLLPD